MRRIITEYDREVELGESEFLSILSNTLTNLYNLTESFYLSHQLGYPNAAGVASRLQLIVIALKRLEGLEPAFDESPKDTELYQQVINVKKHLAALLVIDKEMNDWFRKLMGLSPGKVYRPRSIIFKLNSVQDLPQTDITLPKWIKEPGYQALLTKSSETMNELIQTIEQAFRILDQAYSDSGRDAIEGYHQRTLIQFSYLRTIIQEGLQSASKEITSLLSKELKARDHPLTIEDQRIIDLINRSKGIPLDVVRKIEVILGTIGQPCTIPMQDGWIENGCVEWLVSLDEPKPLPELSHDLREHLIGIQERLRQEQIQDIDEYSTRAKELVLEEPDHMQEEMAKLVSKLEEFVSSLPSPGSEQKIDRLLRKIRNLLRKDLVIAYKSIAEWENVNLTLSNGITVAPSVDQFDILRFERTHGSNQRLMTEDVIEKLKTIDEKYGIDIVGASLDCVEFKLERIPTGKEARELGKWLLGFCPDIYETPESFPAGRIALWWD